VGGWVSCCRDVKATAEAEHPVDQETTEKFGMMPDTR
jgi:hypothetical protein